MELTEKQAVELAIESWTSRAETGGGKEDWEKWEWNGGQYPRMVHHCFGCEYATRACKLAGLDRKQCWRFCPYYKKYGVCDGKGTIYAKWNVAKTKATRKKYAQQYLGQLQEVLRDIEKPSA